MQRSQIVFASLEPCNYLALTWKLVACIRHIAIQLKQGKGIHQSEVEMQNMPSYIHLSRDKRNDLRRLAKHLIV